MIALENIPEYDGSYFADKNGLDGSVGVIPHIPYRLCTTYLSIEYLMRPRISPTGNGSRHGPQGHRHRRKVRGVATEGGHLSTGNHEIDMESMKRQVAYKMRAGENERQIRMTGKRPFV